MFSKFFNTLSSVMSFQSNETIKVCICLGAHRHVLEVFGDTTVEEMITLVRIEILKETPPDVEYGEAQDYESVRLIFKGKQLSSPTDTMDDLKVKSGDKMMVLRRKQNAPSTSANPEDDAKSVLNPAFRDLKKMVTEVQSIEEKVRLLSKEVNEFTKPSQQAADVLGMKKCLKTLAGVNEEHMKLLFKLDALETNGIDEIRTERKAMVVKVQKSQGAVDDLSSKLKTLIPKEGSS